MIFSAIFSALLRLFGPEVDEANAAAVAELEVYDACKAPLWEQAWDCPERVRWALAAISDRECPGNYCAHRKWVGRHRQDSVHDEGIWRRGHARGERGYHAGALHWWCPAHATPTGMSTVGPHGLIYAFNVHRMHVLGNCVPWWVFASPTVSAQVARERYLKLCGPQRRSGWCPSVRSSYRSWKRRCARRDLPRKECREGESA